MRFFRCCAYCGGVTWTSANTTEPKEFRDLRFVLLLQHHRSVSTFQPSGLLKAKRHVRTGHITHLVEQPRGLKFSATKKDANSRK